MPRLLICGDVLGQFDALFKRVAALHKSKAGPFDMLLVYKPPQTVRKSSPS